MSHDQDPCLFEVPAGADLGDQPNHDIDPADPIDYWALDGYFVVVPDDAPAPYVAEATITTGDTAEPTPAEQEPSDATVIDFVAARRRREQYGDADSNFESAYHLHNPLLRNVIARFKMPYADQEEVLQGVWMRYLQHRHKFEGRSELSTWLYRIAVNAAITAQSRLKRRLAHEDIIGDGESIGHEVDPSNVRSTHHRYQPPESTAIFNTNLGQLNAAIDELPEKLRHVIRLWEQGLSHEEIADKLDITVSAAKVRLFRARQKLEPHRKLFSR